MRKLLNPAWFSLTWVYIVNSLLAFQADHVHVVFSIPPKYSVSSLMGCLKGQTFHSSFRPIRKTGEVLLGSSFVGAWVLCEQRWFG